MTNEAAIEIICDLIAESGRQLANATDHELPDIQDTMDALVMAVRMLKHADADKVKIDPDADSNSDWIPVTQKKPPVGEKVLVTIEDDSADCARRYVDVGWYLDGWWIVDNEYGFNVISWKPFERQDERKKVPAPIPW